MAYAPGPVVNRDPYRPGLGLLPVAIPAVESAVSTLTSLLNISGKAVDKEKPIAQALNQMAQAGNLTAFAIMIARGTIATQGFSTLYAPLTQALENAHPDWYQQAVALTQAPPQGHALWNFPEDANTILSFATLNAVYAASAPQKPGTLGPGGMPPAISAAGFSSPLAIAAILGAVFFMTKPKSRRR